MLIPTKYSLLGLHTVMFGLENEVSYYTNYFEINLRNYRLK